MTDKGTLSALRQMLVKEDKLRELVNTRMTEGNELAKDACIVACNLGKEVIPGADGQCRYKEGQLEIIASNLGTWVSIIFDEEKILESAEDHVRFYHPHGRAFAIIISRKKEALEAQMGRDREQIISEIRTKCAQWGIDPKEVLK